MRAAPLLLTFLLLLPPATAAPFPPTEVRFDSPAVLDGELNATFAGRLVALASRSGQPLSIALESDVEGVLVNRTKGYVLLHDDLAGGGSYPAPSQSDSHRTAIARGTRISLARPEGGSLVIDAARITVAAAVHGARLAPVPDNGDLSRLFPAGGGEVMGYWRVMADPADAVVALGAAEGLRVTVAGLRLLAWSNAEVTCPTGAPCPPGGAWAAQQQEAGSTRLRVGSAAFEEFTPATGGRASAAGAASEVLLVAREATHAVTGTLRLPAASSDLGCAACLGANHTLTAAGHLVLERTRHEEGRMAATLGGDASAARLDERAVDLPVLLGGSALGVTAVASLALWRLLAGLFTKMKSDPLEHPRRRRIFDYIQANPGASFREVARSVGVAAGTARHHLMVLKRHGLVMQRSHGSTVRYFENHGKFDATWSDVVLLRDGALRHLHDWLVAHPGVAQKEVLEGMLATRGWSRSTTQHRLERLVKSGMVELRVQGRRRLYRPRPPAAEEPVASPT